MKKGKMIRLDEEDTNQVLEGLEDYLKDGVNARIESFEIESMSGNIGVIHYLMLEVDDEKIK